ncbi:hypothetical protein J1N35_003928 [Gossypium stocksii]|uniref:Sulfotransferase n=1 Tax=Gossypium stocksii TaxID=47602 RepID=A0A9D4AHJ2_9ROSI|nr:hypothetical protein J1N35_003928 [Gossypium stocksii]
MVTDLYNWEGFCFVLPRLPGRTSKQTTLIDDPLLKHNPNELMRSLEVQLFKENPNPDLSYMPSPRLFQATVPYPMLPQSVKNSACKIVYITREPKDTFVSLWHFLNSFTTAKGIDPCR